MDTLSFQQFFQEAMWRRLEFEWNSISNQIAALFCKTLKDVFGNFSATLVLFLTSSSFNIYDIIMKFSRLLNISWQETVQLNQNVFFFSKEMKKDVNKNRFSKYLNHVKLTYLLIEHSNGKDKRKSFIVKSFTSNSSYRLKIWPYLLSFWNENIDLGTLQ